MKIIFSLFNNLAIVLPSLRISSQLLIGIATIALHYAAALSFIVVYIQSIGSGIGIFSGLFPVTLISQNVETLGFFDIVTVSNLLFFSVLPVVPCGDKPSRRLTAIEKSQFTLTDELKQILVGLLLGDAHIQKHKLGINPRLVFVQGLINKDYLLHLYDLFKTYSPQEPTISDMSPHRRTGKVYSKIYFSTYSLPCFLELYNLFYVAGTKIVPSNIEVLFTPLSLVYLICDDGSFCQRDKAIILNT
uniref:LAGLIDADG homing endonuclease n=1 Tax=Rhizoctonia solani TaxID=456999 RepID=A0A8E8GQX8_9AGAM|nr:LAGLIDADG homing endonuclease [Rhizoctonia solani]